MSPREEIAAAVKTLSDAADDVLTHKDHWPEMFADDNRCERPEVNRFIRAMNPAVARHLADWLTEWEDIEFTEHGPLSDDLAAALRLARAINGGPS